MNKCPAHCKVSGGITKMKAVACMIFTNWHGPACCPTPILLLQVPQLPPSCLLGHLVGNIFLLEHWPKSFPSCLQQMGGWQSFPAAEPHCHVRSALWSPGGQGDVSWAPQRPEISLAQDPAANRICRTPAGPCPPLPTSKRSVCSSGLTYYNAKHSVI